MSRFPEDRKAENIGIFSQVLPEVIMLPSEVFEPHFLLKAGLLGASIAIAVLQFFGSDSRLGKAGRVVLTLTIAVLGLTFVNEVLDTQEEVENTQKTLNEIQRTMERIERVSAFVEVVVRSDHPSLRAYRDRLEHLESGCLRQLADLLEMEDPLGRRVPRVFLIEDECLPDPLSEPFASMALGFLIVDLQFFRSERPLSQCSDEGLADAKPDLFIPLRASLADGTLQLIYDRLEHTFILRAQKLESNSLTFDGSGRIAAVGDLAGSRMIIDLRSFGLARSESAELTRSMMLGDIRLRFAGARTHTVDSSEFVLEPVHQNSSVHYLYCFPEELSEEAGRSRI